MGDNGGVKRNAAKSKSTASGAKKPRTKAEREKTGAPSAGFLSATYIALDTTDKLI